MHSGSDYVWKAWGNLLHSASTGENAFQNLNGKSIWDYRLDHPKQAAVFNRAYDGDVARRCGGYSQGV